MHVSKRDYRAGLLSTAPHFSRTLTSALVANVRPIFTKINILTARFIRVLQYCKNPPKNCRTFCAGTHTHTHTHKSHPAVEHSRSSQYGQLIMHIICYGLKCWF